MSNPTEGTEFLCECADLECPSPTHLAKSPCEANGTVQLRRVDYADYGIDSWMWFCEGCAEDALASGVFSTFNELNASSADDF